MKGLNKIIGMLDKVGVFSRWTNVVGIVLLFLMIFATFIDVFMRYVFNRPIIGVLEITELMMIAAVFLAIAHTHNEKGHVSVDVITTKLAPKARLVTESATTLIGLGIFVIVAWRALIRTLWFIQNNTLHTDFIAVPSAPFGALIVLGCTALCLLLLRDLLKNVTEALRLGFTWYHWLMMVGVPILFVVLAALWMQPDLWQINLATVGVIGVIFSLLAFLSGMPISFALILTGIVFIGHIRGPDASFSILGAEIYRTTGSYSFAVVTFFVIMGYFCLYAKFGEDLYYAAYRWLGHLPGGMAIATIGACTGFAAIVGDSLSATVTMGTVSMPQMKKYQYDDRLSTGSITAGATLGPLIPPSVTFIVYGVLTEVSIGKLFVGGILPGLLMATCFIITIYIWCRINPKAGRPGERSAWIPRLVSLRAGGPVAFLFIVVIGGIYMGVFSPSEGGGIGAVGALFIALAMRRFTWKSFAQSLLGAGKVISMVFLILNGAVLFTRFLAWCNLSNLVTQSITSLGLSSAGVVMIILLVFLVLGCFVDVIALIFIAAPIVHPLAMALGCDPIWFAVLFVMDMNLGMLTPPVGINLFALKGIVKDVPMNTIYQGAIPFVIASVVSIVIVFVVPSVATWLPTVLK